MSTFNDLPDEMQQLVVKYFPRPQPKIDIIISSVISCLDPLVIYIHVTLLTEVASMRFEREYRFGLGMGMSRSNEATINALEEINKIEDWVEHLDESFKLKLIEAIDEFKREYIEAISNNIEWPSNGDFHYTYKK
jgi:hypothetical protein